MNTTAIAMIDHGVRASDVDHVHESFLHLIGLIHDEEGAWIGLYGDVDPKTPAMHVRPDAVLVGAEELPWDEGGDLKIVKLFSPEHGEIQASDLLHALRAPHSQTS